MPTLNELSLLIGGQLVNGDEAESLEINGAASISFAHTTDITFVTSQKYLDEFESGPALAAIVPHGLTAQTKPCIQVENPEASFATIVEIFRPAVKRPKLGISPQATISPSARISDDVCIHPGAVIMDDVEIGCGCVIFPNVTVMENCQIGSHTKIFPNVVLYENTQIGDRCLIHAGAVIGAFGFGYDSSNGQHVLSPQLGNVRIESDVEIGANTTIDRSTYDSTIVASGTKLDNLVMVGHNCKIGEHNLLCSQVGIAGSCQTGESVVMGGQVGMADHLNIGSRAAIGAKSGLMHDVAEGQKMFGIPARPAREEMQLLASRAKLPEMRKSIRQLEKQLKELEQISKPTSLPKVKRDAA